MCERLLVCVGTPANAVLLCAVGIAYRYEDAFGRRMALVDSSGSSLSLRDLLFYHPDVVVEEHDSKFYLHHRSNAATLASADHDGDGRFDAVREGKRLTQVQAREVVIASHCVRTVRARGCDC